ncbi:MAG: hypothetical protein WCN98_07390 [Verrucomicrobiaceae bacterium]
MFETRQQKLLSPHRFVRRQLASLLLGLVTLGVALSIGVAGYHWIGGLAWVDALLDASMILSGMGPVSPLPTDAAKIFASAYALFSGVVFISVMAIILSPAVHRLLHKFHVDEHD